MMEKTCLHCGKPIHGRADKKFCCDECRTDYHNHIRRESERGIRTVNRILASNWKILTAQLRNGISRLPVAELAGQNFNFKVYMKEDVADFIISHISEPLDVELLARHFGFSRSHFTKKFSRAAGIAPGSFLEELRLDFALRLMLTERKSVKEAAAASGFSDASYFCRRFRGRYGTSPSQYIAAASNGKGGPERA